MRRKDMFLLLFINKYATEQMSTSIPIYRLGNAHMF